MMAGAALLSISTAGFYWTARVAWADWVSRDQTAESIGAAIRLAPDNWNFYRRLAEIRPADALRASRRGAELNPLNPTMWMELGGYAENAGDYGTAEKSLLRAVALDRTFAPRLLLSEFYFRRRDAEKFWPSVRGALSMTSENPTALFEECWALRPEADFILQNAIPDRPEIVREYLEFLLAQNRLRAAGQVVGPLMKHGPEPRVAEPLLAYCDRLITAGSGARAVEVWNWLATSKLIRYGKLWPEVGRSLTNGTFERPPMNRGFDWRYGSESGVFVEHDGKRRAVRISFTGRQPENCELISQFVVVKAGANYGVRVRYRIPQGADGASGLIWRAMSAAGVDLAGGGGRLTGGGGTGHEYAFGFATGSDTEWIRLVLKYERIRGTMRTEGSAEIDGVDLELVRASEAR